VPLKKTNILLIDDNKDELIFFNEALAELKFPYSLSYSPYYTSHIFQTLEEKKLNILFLDINMPGKSGLHFLADIKADKKFKRIPVIMYSVSVRDEDIEKAYQLGAHHYLVKPYAHHNFVESLRTIFKLDWTIAQPKNTFENFVVNLAFA
jgi:CheY-like chemotaxis protein